ncbi:MAG: IPT/TIG domain-containing protein [Flavobacteriaceae bacterium]|uniref:IPT/TIG domain-containing protein n=1 Tax=Flagellimonas sp. SN16 TaxID=3415142 RepID=UPI003C5AAADA|nr:IPT/TIG domain-containing protein [Flavobacteriaceae bacterium]
MKKAILVGLSILALSLNTSCGKDDGPAPEPEVVEITSFSPASGTVGTEVTITGKNFSTTKTGNNVTFNGTAATVKSATATNLKVDVPNGATTGKIKVTVGNSSATSATNFEVTTTQAAPTISGLDVSAICAGGEVVISGANFGSSAQDAAVYIDGEQATVTAHASNSLTIEAPQTAVTGLVEVKVSGQSGFSEAQLEVYPAPVITGLSINEGEWGSEVTIQGTFGQGLKIHFNDKEGQNLEVSLDGTEATKMYVYVPEGARTGTFIVSDNCGNTTESEEFTVFHGRWTQVADFGGGERSGMIAFAVGDKGYVGTGVHDGSIFRDIWEYDPNTDQWTQKADFGGGFRSAAVSFVIDNTAYAGTGSLGTTLYQDIWSYDSGADMWNEETIFLGSARRIAVGFSIGDKGYIGTGKDQNQNLLKDFWEYDSNDDTWTQKTDVGAVGRFFSVGFAIGDKGYIGTGFDVNSNFLNDFWEYDPSNNTWTQKADVGAESTVRSNAVGFAIKGKGYIGTGIDDPINQNLLKDFWEYDPTDDTWVQVASFPGEARQSATVFVINGKAYVGLGNGSNGSLKDFWEFDPDPDPEN